MVGDARAVGGLRTGRRQTGWICTLTAGDVAGELCLTRDELRFDPSEVRARARSLSVSPRSPFLSLACVRASSRVRARSLFFARTLGCSLCKHATRPTAFGWGCRVSQPGPAAVACGCQCAPLAVPLILPVSTNPMPNVANRRGH